MKVSFKHVLIALTFFLHQAAAQLPVAQQHAITLQRQMQLKHYSPRQVDDSLSSSVFNSFIKQLDPQQDLFLADEYKTITTFRYAIDDELNGSSWKFLDLATGLYRKVLARADSLIKVILQKPVDFSTDENIVFQKKTTPVFAKDIKELQQKWNRWFKYVMLSNATSIAAADSTNPSLKKVMTDNETVIREKIIKGQAKIFKELLNQEFFSTEVKETFFNAITTSFDPHSNFFSPKQQEDFQSELSTEEYSFGFDISETKEGKIKIDMLIPGGPAWKTGDIHKEDEILQLQWKGKEPVDVSTISIDDVDEMLAKSNHDELLVKLKKPDGTIRTIALRKEKIETEEDIVKGFLLAGEKKVGYIALPDFYTQWEDEGGSGCANDVAKEIIKMKKENLDGLILDLRYNGGGSLYEALQLCGIFIDDGPLVGTKEKDGKLTFDKDPNRGTIYDGPLVLLVNNQSASASELVAAALQDYNRAVIVGSPTFGKATMQVVFPLDSNAKQDVKSLNGYVKITTGKLFRLNGETAQRNGVIPDVILPDAFDGLEYTEKFMPYVLPADTARKNNYYKQLAALPVAALKTNSQSRVTNNSYFADLIKSISKKKEERAAGKMIVPLKPEAFEKWNKEREALEDALDDEDSVENKLFVTDNYRMEKERLQNNAYAAELNKYTIESIQSDSYIQEAFSILIDLIKLQKK